MSLSAKAEGWRDTLVMARKAYQEKAYDKAYNLYQKAQKGAPKDLSFSDEMAQSAYKARKFDLAEKHYNESISKAKSKTAKLRNYHNLGNAQMKQKKYNEAISSYKNALKINPNDQQTKYNLSEALRNKKEQQNKQNQQNQKQQQNQNKQNQQQKNQQNQQQQNQNNQKVPNKPVERMLDELMKAEANTKRKIGGEKGEKSNNNSGKDW